ncbi:MAG: hypothetical protein QXU98_11145 [Candidatus Parvarchaeota archaeon]
MNDDKMKEQLINEINKEIDNAIKENESLRATYLQLTIKEEELLAEKKKLEKEEAQILKDLRISNSLLVELVAIFNRFERTHEINGAATLKKILDLVALAKLMREKHVEPR